MVDEAHAVGVLGATGAGSCELYGVDDRVDLRMGTFSKSLASCGGFIAGPADVVEFLKIASRPFMFTAAAVPAAVGAALEARADLPQAEGGPLFEKLLANASYLRRGFADLGLRVVDPGRLPDGAEATTPVVPVVVGEDWQAVLLWKALFDAGVYTNVALHPAVPPGGALLRTSLMATHERSHLDRALEIFAKVTAEFPRTPPRWVVSACPLSDKPNPRRKSLLLANDLVAESGARVDARRPPHLGCHARRTSPRGRERPERTREETFSFRPPPGPRRTEGGAFGVIPGKASL